MQGFVQFTIRDEVSRLDVDELNERLAVKGRLRLRHSMKPDEGYGIIFFFDGVLCNMQRIKAEAWQAVARERGAARRRRASLRACTLDVRQGWRTHMTIASAEGRHR